MTLLEKYCLWQKQVTSMCGIMENSMILGTGKKWHILPN